jgi:hypothetical protein
MLITLNIILAATLVVGIVAVFLHTIRAEHRQHLEAAHASRRLSASRA